MKKIILFIAVLISVTGCAAIERAGDLINGNPLIADTMTRQAVARYIGAGETEQEQFRRATDVKTVVERALVYMEGNPQTDVRGIVDVVETQIDWDRLSPGDRLLVQDIMVMVQLSLAERQADEQLSQDTVIAIRSLLRTAVSAASLFI